MEEKDAVFVDTGSSVDGSHTAYGTHGDDGDGHVDWSFAQIAATVALSALWVGECSAHLLHLTVVNICQCEYVSSGSQIPLYFVGGSLSYISADIGGASAMSWLPISNTLALASVSPFVGYLSDLFGRRNITLVGSVVLMIGITVVGTAHSFAQGVAGSQPLF